MPVTKDPQQEIADKEDGECDTQPAKLIYQKESCHRSEATDWQIMDVGPNPDRPVTSSHDQQ
jgi:hypothetical protein